MSESEKEVAHKSGHKTKWLDFRTIFAILAILLAAWATHQITVEESARRAATCRASTESRHDIIQTFEDATRRLLREHGDAGDIAAADQIDKSVHKTLGGPSPLCKVP